MAEQARKDWVIQIKKKVECMRLHPMPPSEEEDAKLWSKRSIYRVPPYISCHKRNAYTPKMVSFGPYHHDDDALKPMEEHKMRALVRFLTRRNRPIEDYINALDKVAQVLMDCYDELDSKYRRDKERFLRLMILDGCFLLEVLNQKSVEYAGNDPIFSPHGMLHNMPHIRRDMLMLENQLPLLVLETLDALGRDATEVKISFTDAGTEANKNDRSLNNLILKFCNPNFPRMLDKEPSLHVLDVVRKSMLLGPCHTNRDVVPQSNGDIIRSVTELRETGVRFRKSSTNGLKDISFGTPSGTLKLPCITIDDSTEFTFLNLMAFERLHHATGNEVTSYVFFMDNLIDTAKDVYLLRSKGIIRNALGSDKAVAKLFNEISTDTTPDPICSLQGVHQAVYSHCQNYWNKSKANLKHTYFQNPWAIISVVAAGLLLILALTQTIFTVLPYFKPHK